MSTATLSITSTTLRWLRDDPAYWRLGASRRWRMAWQAGWADFNWQISRKLLSQRPATAIDDPVLILAPWRSGTTAMHELLVRTTGLATVQTWQSMNATSFTLTGPPRRAAAVRRPMDGLSVESDSAQEDEFALLTLGAATAYRAFLAPHRVDELGFTLDPAYWRADGNWIGVWETFLRATLAASNAPQPILLKSPNHTYRIDSILQRFPRARLVWMVRDPFEVFHSNRKMWNAMFELYALTLPPPGALDRFLARALQSAGETIDRCCAALPIDRLVVVSVHQVRDAPDLTARAVSERLGLPIGQKKASTEHAYRAQSWSGAEKATLPRAALEACTGLKAAYARALTSHGIR